MKTFFTQYKWLAWVLVILIVLNLSAIGTIVYTIYNRNNVVMRHSPMPPRISHMQPGVFMREELNLSEKQFETFLKARKQHQESVLGIRKQVGDLKMAYINRLIKEPVDSAALYKISDSIGHLQKQLILETGRYYSAIRTMCNEEQTKKLNAFFRKMIRVESIPGEGGNPVPMHRKHQIRRTERQKRLNN